MSIVVLQRKSRRFKEKISGKGEYGFSINGGHRNQGWVGQGIRGRSIIKTPFRGNIPMGNGGCCGEYRIAVLKGSNCCTNNANIVKRSTMNTKPFLLAKVSHPTSVFVPNINCGTCINWVKSFDPYLHSEGLHTKNIKTRDAIIDFCCDLPKDEPYKCKDGKCPPVVKDVNTKSYDTYNAYNLFIKNDLPTPPCKQHFPMVLNHNSSCQINYKTAQKAIVAGALPEDWGNCGNQH